MERERVELELVDASGVRLGAIAISTLPGRERANGLPALLDLSGIERELEPIQLLEGCEYVFEVIGAERAETDRPELFVADNRAGTRGWLRTNVFTGRIDVRVTVNGAVAMPCAFEVRSSKLGYRDDYREMLSTIAERTTTWLLHRFAPNAQRITPNSALDAESVYQQFVFLNGLLASGRLDAALHRVISDPYVQWRAERESNPPARGLRASGDAVRQLVRSGARTAWPGSPHAALSSIPLRVDAARTIETVDNVPNRFVLYALREWQSLVATLMAQLERERATSSAVVRGLRECGALADRIAARIRAPMFAGVGRLDAFPTANQVLQKRAGYREILHAYLLVDAGADLAWAGGADVFGAGQRNVATLYEYWVFLELASIVRDLCGGKLDTEELFARERVGTALRLQRAHARVVRGTLQRGNRAFSIELCFNQTFAPPLERDPDLDGTWTRRLRPDCSLHVTPLDAPRGQDVWLFFDAKYRIDRADELFADLDPRKQDLDKMHVYRDAILRAVGAYIVFPGTVEKHDKVSDEVLPSLGAFPLRPSANGAEGAGAIAKFLERVFDHLANQGARHERSRFWQRAAQRGPRGDVQEAWPHLTHPPADTIVLLGFVKSRAHHAWIQEQELYNLRADRKRHGAVGLNGRELSAEFLALYGELDDGPALFRIVDEPQILSVDELVDRGYPEPRGSMYFCLRIDPVEPPASVSRERIRAVLDRARGDRPAGRPVVVTWLDLVPSRD